MGEDKVRKASGTGDKALRLDGFTLASSRQCWSTIEGEVMEIIAAFWETGEFERSINASSIPIILKKEGALMHMLYNFSRNFFY